MKEYEIYLPMTGDESKIDQFKETLARAFGGYTHLRQRNEGAWSMGGVTFRDEVTIVRVLDDGTSKFDMLAFKKLLEEKLEQQTILIVEREVKVIAESSH